MGLSELKFTFLASHFMKELNLYVMGVYIKFKSFRDSEEMVDMVGKFS